MIENAFTGHAAAPSDEDLAEVLGPAKSLWDNLAEALAARPGANVREWNSYSPKAGWALRLRKQKRAIVYLSPGRGGFLASFALGEKAMAAARGRLPERVHPLLDNARHYAEGAAVRVEVRTAADTEIVQVLAEAKAAN